MNALGVYIVFHLSALQKATRLANERLSREERRALARAALADEAFAVHFLQDAFAAGHVAGTWGDTSQRKGTHDHYNENGLEVFTWNHRGTTLVLMGDAHAPMAPDAVDVCKETGFIRRPEPLRMAPEAIPMFTTVLVATPVPGLGAGLGSIQRFRSELGSFIGLAGSIDARRIGGGFEAPQTRAGWVGGLDLSFRAGVGLDGVVGESGDGLIFVSVGLRADTASSNKFTDSAGANTAGNITAAIPARTGLSLRARMPFYLVPGDLLLLSPLYLVAPERYAAMASRSVSSPPSAPDVQLGTVRSLGLRMVFDWRYYR